MRIHDTSARLEHKEDNRAFPKCKVLLLCTRGDQQIPAVSFKESELYAPVLKATGARLLLALAAVSFNKVVKTDVKHAYL